MPSPNRFPREDFTLKRPLSSSIITNHTFVALSPVGVAKSSSLRVIGPKNLFARTVPSANFLFLR